MGGASKVFGSLLSREFGRARLPCAADLERLAARDPIVRAYLHAWRAGSFASLEQCLIGLVLDLAKRNERYAAAELDRLLTTGPKLKPGDRFVTDPAGETVNLTREQKRIRLSERVRDIKADEPFIVGGSKQPATGEDKRRE